MKKIISVLAVVFCLALLISCKDKGIEYTQVEGGYEVSGYVGDKTEIKIPRKYEGEPVIGIGEGAFYNCKEIQEIKLPKTITYIGEEAFYNCFDLQTINMPASVVKMGKGAFSGCTFIDYERVGGCNYLGSWLISLYDENQTTIDVRDGTVGICDYAFYENKKIKTIKLPETVKTIGEKSFKNCSSLENLNLPDSVRTIGNDALYGCINLKFEVVDGANYINNWLISRQDLEIENLVVRDGTVGIYGYAFYDSYMLISVTIPSSVKVIGENAFFNCMYIKELNIAEGVEEIGMYAFFKCIKIKPITIPASVTKIGTGAFSNCRGTIDCKAQSEPAGYEKGWNGELTVNYGK